MILSARIMFVLSLFMAFTPVQLREELGRLPQLVKHYQLHKAENPNLGILEFYKIHYAQGYAAHKDAHDHSDLPGKQGHEHGVQCCISAMTLPLSPFLAELSTPDEYSSSRYFPHDFLLPDSPASGIWQPPRKM